LMPVLQLVGGSHAQRDVFDQIWLESLVRSGHPIARNHLLDRRKARNGRNRFAQERLLRLSEASGMRAASIAALSLTPQPQLH
jgi:pyrroloquinoline quinone (PQQ) biosynthesis protein C